MVEVDKVSPVTKCHKMGRVLAKVSRDIISKSHHTNSALVLKEIFMLFHTA